MDLGANWKAKDALEIRIDAIPNGECINVPVDVTSPASSSYNMETIVRLSTTTHKQPQDLNVVKSCLAKSKSLSH